MKKFSLLFAMCLIIVLAISVPFPGTTKAEACTATLTCGDSGRTISCSVPENPDPKDWRTSSCSVGYRLVTCRRYNDNYGIGATVNCPLCMKMDASGNCAQWSYLENEEMFAMGKKRSSDGDYDSDSSDRSSDSQRNNSDPNQILRDARDFTKDSKESTTPADVFLPGSTEQHRRDTRGYDDN